MINVTSTTDTPEEVAKVIADGKPPEVKPAEAPPAKTAEELAAETAAAAPKVEAVVESDEEVEEPETPAGEEGKPATPPKKKGGFQKKIDKLTARVHQVEQENQRLRTVTPPVRQPETPPVTDAADKKPNPVDFESHADYIEAVAKHATKQTLKEAETARKQGEEKTQREATKKQWNDQLVAARKVIPDFDEVMTGEVPITGVMSEAIISSDIGAELAYHLGKNPEDAKRIAALSPIAAVREIGKIESQILAKKAPLNQPPPKKPEKPAPLDVSGGNSTVTVEKPLGELPYREFVKVREKQLGIAK